MKKIFLAISVFISTVCFGQYSFFTPQGATNNQWYNKGSFGVDGGIVFRTSFADTAAANSALYIPGTAGIMIRVGDTTYLRNSTATGWLNMMRGSGGGSQTWQQTLATTGGHTITTDHTVDFTNHAFNWNNLTELNISQDLGGTGPTSMTWQGISSFSMSTPVTGGIIQHNATDGTSISNVKITPTTLTFSQSGVSPGNYLFPHISNSELIPQFLTGVDANKRLSTVELGDGLAFVGNQLVNTGMISGWGLTGNAGTDPATNFIGTTDNKGLMFKTNNFQSGYIDLSGSENTSFGYGALSVNNNGGLNTAFGASALLNNNDGSNNTGIGWSALNANTDGISNTSVGAFSLKANTTGNNNVAIGTVSMQVNETGLDNVAVGAFSLEQNLASLNTAIGFQAMLFNTTGEQNTAVGANALLRNTTAIKNTGVGAGVWENTTTGGFNTGLGHDAGLSNTTGAGNVALGYLALASNTTGFFNTSAGYWAGRSITTGDRNTFIGDSAGYDPLQKVDAVNSMALGYDTHTDADNQVVIGNTSILSTYLRGAIYLQGSAGTSGQTPVSAGSGLTAWGYGDIKVGTTPVISGTDNQALFQSSGKVSQSASFVFNNSTSVLSVPYIGQTNFILPQSFTFSFGSTTATKYAQFYNVSNAIGLQTVGATNGMHYSVLAAAGGYPYHAFFISGTEQFRIDSSGYIKLQPRSYGSSDPGNGANGAIYYNNATNKFRVYENSAWVDMVGSGGTVTSVSGTTNRITSTGGTTPVIDISASFVGQSSITTLGTVTTGTIGTGAVIARPTMTLGSDATGDIYYRNGSGILTRLGVGSNGDVLTLATGLPSWAAASAGTPAGNYGNVQLNRNSAFATPGSDSLNFVSGTGLTTKGGVTSSAPYNVTADGNGMLWATNSGSISASVSNGLKLTYSGGNIYLQNTNTYFQCVSSTVMNTSSSGLRIGDATDATKLLDVQGTALVTGVVTLSNLAGTGSRAVVADASGNLSTLAGGLTSGTYTPSLSNTTNVTSSTPIVCHYTRVGNQVTVTGSAGVVTTLAVATVLSISLPVASNFGATTDAAGIGQATSAIATNAYVQANATSDLAELTFIGLSVGGSGTLYFSFTYTVI